MTAHLLTITVGPVQEFIAAARRTRDLWFGSMLLSEISKAVAAQVRADGGELIFPAPLNEDDLNPNSELIVANIILAELKAGVDPKAVATNAKKAAQQRWREFADAVFKDYREVIRPMTSKESASIWDEQVDDVIEFAASWVPYDPTNPENYSAQRRRLMRLQAGRKNGRDFSVAKGRAGVPKSSLDGLRESVLKDPELDPWPARARRRLRVRPGEQLDVVGLIKRAALGHKPFPSVSRVGADSWVCGIVRAGGQHLLDQLADVCRTLCAKELLHELKMASHPQYSAFPFEGTTLYRNRHHELIEETGEPDDTFVPLGTALAAVEAFGADQRLGKQPAPYLAVLVADGDKMGDLISQLSSPAENRRFSGALSRFADQARAIVRKQQGVLVYAGGDDVMAFVPVDKCLTCARELHDLFGQLLRELIATLNETRPTPLDAKPTLSVGLAVAHFLDDLEDLLNYGRAAEHQAKNPLPEDGTQTSRNGLAVHLHKRGGGPVRVRQQWVDGHNRKFDDSLDDRLAQLAKWLCDAAISNRVAYDLAHVADVYDDWPGDTVAEAVRQDALRVVAAKKPHSSVNRMAEVRALIRDRVTDAASLRRLADELLVARQLAS